MTNLGPTGKARILQIHPTRRCNLQCLHCYSSSGPQENSMLGGSLLRAAVSDAARQGYNVVSMSGGEPLLYPPLRNLLQHARSRDMRTTVTTNGMLLDERRLRIMDGVTDLVAISLDGVPASHNRMRGSDRAFEKMRGRLAGLRSTGIPFGFIFTLTQRNLHELDWVTKFAVDEGADLLQVHPLEEVGRAREILPGERPDELEASVAFLEVARLRKVVGDQLNLQLDLVNRRTLHRHPERVYASEESELHALQLADIVSPLVIETDGTVVPLEYGFSRQYALGNLNEDSLENMIDSWRRASLERFMAMSRSVFRETTESDELPFFNWYEAMFEKSHHDHLQSST